MTASDQERVSHLHRLESVYRALCYCTCSGARQPPDRLSAGNKTTAWPASPAEGFDLNVCVSGVCVHVCVLLGFLPNCFTDADRPSHHPAPYTHQHHPAPYTHQHHPSSSPLRPHPTHHLSCFTSTVHHPGWKGPSAQFKQNRREAYRNGKT